MAREEIETTDSDVNQQSGQEHWFTRLPVVMTFMLSRFLFNQSAGRPEKIHKKFLFEKLIYMDRYMESNKDQTRVYREEVKKLKDKRLKLRTNLKCYMCYGNDTKPAPINDILENTLRFTKSTSPVLERSAKSTPHVSGDLASPSSNSSPVLHTENEVSDTRTTTLCPAPRYVTQSELRVLEACLTRWKSEMEEDVRDINLSLEKVNHAINSMYSGESMKKVPYRLHAVLVHEGQASGGHYWAYIYDSSYQQWRKYNDVMVTDITWEEAERESFGDYGHVSAYCIMYIDVMREKSLQLDQQTDDLPPDLKGFVDKDNEKFEKELCEWDKKQAASLTIQGSPTSEANTSCQAVVSSSHSSASLDTESSHIWPQVDLVELAKKINSAETTLSQWRAAERLRLENVATCTVPPHAEGDVRLQHMAIYLIKCKASTEMVDKAILEQLLDDISNLDCSDSSVVKARNHILKVIDCDRMSSKLSDSQKWKELYGTFQKANTCFLTGLEHFHNEKFQEALPYLVHSYNLNSQLIRADCLERSMNQQLLAFCRRQCFLNLNEQAFFMFLEEDHSQLSRGLDLVTELIIPCVPLLITSPFKEDKQAVDDMRDKWFGLLGENNLDTHHQEELQVFLPKLLDTFEGDPCVQEIKPPPVMRTNARDLCERFSKAMKWVHSSMAFPISS